MRDFCASVISFSSFSSSLPTCPLVSSSSPPHCTYFSSRAHMFLPSFTLQLFIYLSFSTLSFLSFFYFSSCFCFKFSFFFSAISSLYSLLCFLPPPVQHPHFLTVFCSSSMATENTLQDDNRTAVGQVGNHKNVYLVIKHFTNK